MNDDTVTLTFPADIVRAARQQAEERCHTAADYRKWADRDRTDSKHIPAFMDLAIALALEADLPPEPPEVKVGQTWRDTAGYEFKVRAIDGDGVLVRYDDGGHGASSLSSFAAYTLISDAPEDGER